MTDRSLARIRALVERGVHRHPVNIAIHEQATIGERIADGAAAAIGSWRFLIIQTIAVAAWVTLNVIGLVHHWDVFPFVLLNLLFSVQAAYTGPVLLLAGNRQSQKDRLTLEHTFDETEKADRQNQAILARIDQHALLTLAIVQHLGIEPAAGEGPT